RSQGGIPRGHRDLLLRRRTAPSGASTDNPDVRRLGRDGGQVLELSGYPQPGLRPVPDQIRQPLIDFEGSDRPVEGADVPAEALQLQLELRQLMSQSLQCVVIHPERARHATPREWRVTESARALASATAHVRVAGDPPAPGGVVALAGAEPD